MKKFTSLPIQGQLGTDGRFCVEEYKSTSDDWYPNFDGDLVRVTLYLCTTYQNKVWHRVCVWGADDCGMEIDFHGADKAIDALRKFHEVLMMTKVSQTHLLEIGFKWA
jgi:hypothetical protein